MTDEIDWMETFVLNESYQTAYAILMKIDELVRGYSAADGQPPSWDSLIKRQEAFSKDVGRLVLRAVYTNLARPPVLNTSVMWVQVRARLARCASVPARLRACSS